MVSAPASGRPPARSATKKRVVKHQRKARVVDDFQCGICLEDAATSKKKRVVCPCQGKHEFHHRCLMRWCKTKSNVNATCPLCREDIFDFFDPLKLRILKNWQSRPRQRLIYLPMSSLPKRFENDDDVLLPLCIRNPLLFKKASARLKADIDFVNNLISNDIFPEGETHVIFKECSLIIRNNIEIASKVISDTWRSASFIGEELQKDKKFMVTTIKTNSHLKHSKLSAVYNSFSDTIRNEKEMIQVCIGFTSKIFSALSPTMKSDPDIYNRALDRYMIEFDTVNQNYDTHHKEFCIYDKLSDFILLKDSTVERIVKHDPLAIEFIPHASDDTILKKEQYIEAILRNPNAIKFLSPYHFGNETYSELCIEAAKKNGLILQYIMDDQFVTDSIALEACKQNGRAILHVTPAQRKDVNIVLAAIEQYPHAFYYCELKSNYEIVEAAVRKSMKLFHRASPKLKKDTDFLMNILTQYGTEENVDDFITALDPMMLNKKENQLLEDIIPMCLQLNGAMLRHFSDDVRSNLDLCKLAYKQSSEAVRYMSKEIINKYVNMLL